MAAEQRTQGVELALQGGGVGVGSAAPEGAMQTQRQKQVWHILEHQGEAGLE